MLRVVLTMSLSLSLLACSGTVDQPTCEKAAASASWTAKASLSSGPSTCPAFDPTLTLPGGCATGCSCAESGIVWVAPSGAQQAGDCELQLTQNCADGSTLDCRDTIVDGVKHASGSCFYHGPTTSGGLDCQYNVAWTTK